MLSLPSPKTQWEARSRETWIEEREAGNPSIATFGSLMESKQRYNETGYARQLDSWNARTDTLGALLNTAATLA